MPADPTQPRPGDTMALDPVGWVSSPLTDPGAAPKQGDEGSPQAWITFLPGGDPSRPVTGVFSTRSPDRPNPIGLHRVRILAIEGCRIRVGDLEALDGTPVLDVKPVLGGPAER